MSPRGKRISRNFAILSLAQAISRLFAALLVIYLTRVLLADGFGLIVFATGVLAYAGLVVDFGFNSLGRREVARGQIPLSSLVGTVVSMRLLLMLAALGLLSLFVWLTPVSGLAKTVILLYGLSLLTDALDLNWVFLGAELMRLTAIAEVLCQILLTSGVLLLIKEPGQVIFVPLIFLVSRLVSIVWLLVRYKAHFGWFRLELDVTLGKTLFRETLPLSASSAVAMISHNFDLVLLGLWLGFEATGLYGAAYRLVWVPTLLATAYYMALWPSLARAYVEGLDTIKDLLRRSIRITSAVAMGMIVGGILLGGPLIHLLYGAEYHAALEPFQILVIATGLLIVNRHYRVLLVAFNHQVAMLKMMTAAALTNIVLNVILISTHGLPGAAFASLVSEFVILSLGYLYTRRLVGHVPFGRYLIKPAVCALVMGLVLMISQPLPLLVRMVMGGGIYGAAMLALRVITLDEIWMVVGAWLPVRPVVGETGV